MCYYLILIKNSNMTSHHDQDHAKQEHAAQTRRADRHTSVVCLPARPGICHIQAPLTASLQDHVVLGETPRGLAAAARNGLFTYTFIFFARFASDVICCGTVQSGPEEASLPAGRREPVDSLLPSSERYATILRVRPGYCLRSFLDGNLFDLGRPCQWVISARVLFIRPIIGGIIYY